jgi:hypothetical protein
MGEHTSREQAAGAGAHGQSDDEDYAHSLEALAKFEQELASSEPDESDVSASDAHVPTAPPVPMEERSAFIAPPLDPIVDRVETPVVAPPTLLFSATDLDLLAYEAALPCPIGLAPLGASDAFSRAVEPQVTLADDLMDLDSRLGSQMDARGGAGSEAFDFRIEDAIADAEILIDFDAA